MKSKKFRTRDKVITRITSWLAGFTLVALAVWGIRTLLDLVKYEETDDAQVEEYINPVIARVGGYIVAVKFEENQQVKKGDTLLIIDDREYTAQRAQTEASILKAEAQLQVLESNIHTLDEAAQVVKSQVAATKAKLWKQQLDYTRYENLYREESATAQQWENVKAALEVSGSEYQAAQDNYKESLSHIGDTYREKAVVKAEIVRLRSLLERNQLDVGYSVITAPYDGRMGRRTIERQQMINPGEVLAYIVNNETDKWVTANYKETQVRKMHIGDPVIIKADAFPDKTFTGTIISLSPATGSSFSLLPPDNSTGNYVKIVQRIPVRIRLNGSRQEIEPLKAGMNVNVWFNKKQPSRE